MSEPAAPLPPPAAPSRHVVLSGGGTLGPVMPLLAVVEQARAEGRPWRFTWVGTTYGPERDVVARYGLPFVAVVSGKWRRYLSWRNLLTPLAVVAGFCQAFVVLGRLRPDAVLTAGGFVSVPLVWAAWCRRVAVVAHEQDVARGLASRLVAPFARARTAVWAGSSDAVALGNFVRPSLSQGNALAVRERWPASAGRPVVLAVGGGTGALALNRLLAAAAAALTEQAFVVHLTGAGKEVAASADRYVPLAFGAAEFADLLAAADVVVTRAGMGTLSELAALRKAAIVVPMPRSHQEHNAAAVAAAGAGVVLDEPTCTPQRLAATVSDLLRHPDHRQALGEALHRLIPDGTVEFTRRLAAWLPPT